MVRLHWMGPMIAGLAWTGLAWGQAVPPAHPGPGQPAARFITVQEPGRPSQRCQIMRSWQEHDGSRAYQVQVVGGGETMTIVESAPAAPGPNGKRAVTTRIYHWGQGNRTIPGVARPPATRPPFPAAPPVLATRPVPKPVPAPPPVLVTRPVPKPAPATAPRVINRPLPGSSPAKPPALATRPLPTPAPASRPTAPSYIGPVPRQAPKVWTAQPSAPGWNNSGPGYRTPAPPKASVWAGPSKPAPRPATVVAPPASPPRKPVPAAPRATVVAPLATPVVPQKPLPVAPRTSVAVPQRKPDVPSRPAVVTTPPAPKRLQPQPVPRPATAVATPAPAMPVPQWPAVRPQGPALTATPVAPVRPMMNTPGGKGFVWPTAYAGQKPTPHHAVDTTGPTPPPSTPWPPVAEVHPPVTPPPPPRTVVSIMPVPSIPSAPPAVGIMPVPPPPAAPPAVLATPTPQGRLAPVPVASAGVQGESGCCCPPCLSCGENHPCPVPDCPKVVAQAPCPCPVCKPPQVVSCPTCPAPRRPLVDRILHPSRSQPSTAVVATPPPTVPEATPVVKAEVEPAKPSDLRQSWGRIGVAKIETPKKEPRKDVVVSAERLPFPVSPPPGRLDLPHADAHPADPLKDPDTFSGANLDKGTTKPGEEAPRPRRRIPLGLGSMFAARAGELNRGSPTNIAASEANAFSPPKEKPEPKSEAPPHSGNAFTAADPDASPSKDGSASEKAPEKGPQGMPSSLPPTMPRGPMMGGFPGHPMMPPMPPSMPMYNSGNVPPGMANAFTMANPTGRPIPADMGKVPSDPNGFGEAVYGAAPAAGPMMPPVPPRSWNSAMAMRPPNSGPYGPAYGSPYAAPPAAPVAALPASESDHGTAHLMQALRGSLYPSEREMAAEQLSRQNWRTRPEVVEALLTGAREDPAPAVRAGCVRALATMRVNTVPVVTVVQGLQKDTDARVRQEVAEALDVLLTKSRQRPEAGFRRVDSRQ